jgi:hypothetical protein
LDVLHQTIFAGNYSIEDQLQDWSEWNSINTKVPYPKAELHVAVREGVCPLCLNKKDLEGCNTPPVPGPVPFTKNWNPQPDNPTIACQTRDNQLSRPAVNVIPLLAAVVKDKVEPLASPSPCVESAQTTAPVFGQKVISGQLQ